MRDVVGGVVGASEVVWAGLVGGRNRTWGVGERVCAGSGGWEGGMLGGVEGEGMGPLEGGEVVWEEWFGLTYGREVMGRGGKGRDRTGGGGRVVGGSGWCEGGGFGGTCGREVMEGRGGGRVFLGRFSRRFVTTL